MRINKFISVLCCVLFAMSLQAQHIQLLENKGEVGIMGGGSYYHGDIASDKLFYQPNFGAFYKKQLNDYVGIRLTYEYIALGANDIQSANPYEYQRGLNFTRVSHDVSLMGEFYFLKFINGYKQYRFTPYLGFGVGAWKSISGSFKWTAPDGTMINQAAKTPRTYTFPINLGMKYNINGPWNIFGEATYRFTTSDRIDYMSDVYILHGFQGSSSGNDQYFSAKLGISYNLLKIYGPDKMKSPRKSFFKRNEQRTGNAYKKGFFGFLKRN